MIVKHAKHETKNYGNLTLTFFIADDHSSFFESPNDVTLSTKLH